MSVRLTALLTAWALVLLFPSAIRAQETDVQRYQETAGPYLISAAILQSHLSLGKTLFAIDVVEAATGQPIPDARVTIITRRVDSDRRGKGTAHNTPSNPERYDAQLELPSPGTWSITIDVESSLGKVAVEMARLEVPGTRRISSGTFVFMGAFVIIIGGAAYLWWSTSRKRRGSSSVVGPGPGQSSS